MYFGLRDGVWVFDDTPFGEAIPISDIQYQDWLEQISAGKQVIGDDQGQPLLLPLSNDERTVTLEAARQKVDAATTELLETGFQYPTGTYWDMTLKDQMNNQNLYEMRNRLSYPVKSKARDSVFSFGSTSEIETFWTMWTLYKTTTLSNGYATKASLDELTDLELITFLRS